MDPSQSGFLFDDSLWPLLLIRTPVTVTTRQQEEALAVIATYLHRGERLLLLVDLCPLAQVPLEQRHYQVEWFQEHESPIRESLIGMALVINSPIIRLAMSVIFYFKPLPVPLITVPHLDMAATWAADRFEESGLHPVASRIRAHDFGT
jgi:hypothetical protein